MPNLRVSDEDTGLIIEFLKKQSKDPEGKLARTEKSNPQNQEISLHHSEVTVVTNTTTSSTPGTTPAAEKGKN
jgi:hypothetical protein